MGRYNTQPVAATVLAAAVMDEYGNIPNEETNILTGYGLKPFDRWYHAPLRLLGAPAYYAGRHISSMSGKKPIVMSPGELAKAIVKAESKTHKAASSSSKPIKKLAKTIAADAAKVIEAGASSRLRRHRAGASASSAAAAAYNSGGVPSTVPAYNATSDAFTIRKNKDLDLERIREQLIGTLVMRDNTPGTVIGKIDVNPGMFATTTLWPNFRSYEMWQMHSFDIIIQHAVGSNTGGTFYVFYEADPDDAASYNVGQNFNLSEVYNTRRATKMTAWSGAPSRFHVKIDPNMQPKFTDVTVDDVGSITADQDKLRFVSYGAIIFVAGTALPSPTVTLGDIMLSASVRFSTATETGALARPVYLVSSGDWVANASGATTQSYNVVDVINSTLGTSDNFLSYHAANSVTVHPGTGLGVLSLTPGLYYVEFAGLTNSTLAESNLADAISGSDIKAPCGAYLSVGPSSNADDDASVLCFHNDAARAYCWPLSETVPTTADVNMFTGFDRSKRSAPASVYDDWHNVLLRAGGLLQVKRAGGTTGWLDRQTNRVMIDVTLNLRFTAAAALAFAATKLEVTRCCDNTDGGGPFTNRMVAPFATTVAIAQPSGGKSEAVNRPAVAAGGAQAASATDDYFIVRSLPRK